MIDSCHCIFVQTHKKYTTKSEPEGIDFVWLVCLNVGLLIVSNPAPYPSGEGYWQWGGGYACVGAGGSGKSVLPSPHFCCDPEIALNT